MATCSNNYENSKNKCILYSGLLAPFLTLYIRYSNAGSIYLAAAASAVATAHSNAICMHVAIAISGS